MRHSLFLLSGLLLLTGCQWEGPKGPPTFPDEVAERADGQGNEYEIDDEYLIEMEKKP